MENFEYINKGTCSSKVSFDIDNNKIYNVKFIGGCNGNLQGIAALVEGMNIEDVENRLRDIRCGNKSTSCPDQLARALKEFLKSGLNK